MQAHTPCQDHLSVAKKGAKCTTHRIQRHCRLSAVSLGFRPQRRPVIASAVAAPEAMQSIDLEYAAEGAFRVLYPVDPRSNPSTYSQA